ncbi:MAG: hypothetical protein C0616_12105 [Desulfuromonas sp.]|nr:MAG: hypothetical protein C0616_12105 [Desulfuromonas sp.]
MLSLLICAALSVATSLALQYGAGVDYRVAPLAGLAVFAVVYFLLLRFVMKRVAEIMESAQRDIQAGHTEKAISTMKQGFKYAPWQFFVKGQINSQIGTIYYLKKDFSAAFDYLQKGFVRHWAGMAMLAVIYMRRNQPQKMVETFDRAISAGKKEDLLYGVYAFCLDKIGKRDKAIEILEKGLKKATRTEILQANLEALQAGKKMKMMAYGDVWFQFHLEKPGAVIKRQTRAIQGRRKIVRR